MTNQTNSYEEWKAELIRIAAKETNQPETSIKINDIEAREWYNAEWSPYYVFRENWQNDGD